MLVTRVTSSASIVLSRSHRRSRARRLDTSSGASGSAVIVMTGPFPYGYDLRASTTHTVSGTLRPFGLCLARGERGGEGLGGEPVTVGAEPRDGTGHHRRDDRH